jgi:SAM-dependent methyltransferase
MAKRKQKQVDRKRAGGKPTLASLADRHELYEQSVQAPEVDIDFFNRIFAEHRGREPRRLREDFCGTAYVAREWVRSDPRRRAVGIDLDLATLAWAKRAAAALKRKQRRRLSLLCADVLEVEGPPVDLICANNFSFCVFKSRRQLGRYFSRARRSLRPDGLFFCELYGGTEAIIAIEEEREVDDYRFIWEQASYNPLTHETLCHIHFEMADESRLERAFTYDWRLWTLPELQELMLEAGFASVEVYLEGWDEEEDDTDGIFRRRTRFENQEAWVGYVVGLT